MIRSKPGIARKVIAVATKQIGYREGFSNGHWNNKEKFAAEVPGLAWANYQPWCDVFVAWCFAQVNALDLIPVSASVAESRDEWKKRGRFSYRPGIGAQALFGINGDEHTGIVKAYTKKYVVSIEGNTNDDGSAEGNGVYRHTRLRHSNEVYGYGYPKFPEGIVNADPKFASENKQVSRPKRLVHKINGYRYVWLGVTQNRFRQLKKRA